MGYKRRVKNLKTITILGYNWFYNIQSNINIGISSSFVIENIHSTDKFIIGILSNRMLNSYFAEIYTFFPNVLIGTLSNTYWTSKNKMDS